MTATRALERLRTRARGLRRRSAGADRGDAGPEAAGLPFDLDELESQVVWIFGSPRTGSTWLLEQLCDPLRLDDSQDTGFRLPGGVKAKVDALPVNEFLVSSHIAPALGEPIDRNGEVLPATLNNYLAHKPSYLFARDYRDVWAPAVRRFVLVRLYAVKALAEAASIPLAASPSLIVKEVNGSHAADVVMSLFPRSKMLFLVRDGRDVIDSLAHAAQGGGWLAEYDGAAQFATDEERVTWLRRASRDWACAVDASRRAYSGHSPALRHLVRYESLVADTAGTLREICDWLGLKRTEQSIDAIVARHAFSAIPEDRRGSGRKRRAATPGLWRANLSEEEQAAAQEIMGGRLSELGYSP